MSVGFADLRFGFESPDVLRELALGVDDLNQWGPITSEWSRVNTPVRFWRGRMGGLYNKYVYELCHSPLRGEQFTQDYVRHEDFERMCEGFFARMVAGEVLPDEERRAGLAWSLYTSIGRQISSPDVATRCESEVGGIYDRLLWAEEDLLAAGVRLAATPETHAFLKEGSEVSGRYFKDFILQADDEGVDLSGFSVADLVAVARRLNWCASFEGILLRVCREHVVEKDVYELVCDLRGYRGWEEW